MCEYPLRLSQGHLLARIDGQEWVLDTGSPLSFGDPGAIELAGERNPLARSGAGVDARALSGFLGEACAGLLGTDLLGRFDHRFDVAGGSWTLAGEELALEGGVPLAAPLCLGVPRVQAEVSGRTLEAFFDTGAWLSYLPEDCLEGCPGEGTVQDFLPAFGTFEVETFRVEVGLGAWRGSLRCAALPEAIALLLGLTGTEGILGSEVLTGQPVLWSPRRGWLALDQAGPSGGSMEHKVP